MKKMMSLLALAVVGSVVAASAEDSGVLSANAVGYVKKNIKGGALMPIVMPFDLLNSDVDQGIEFIKTQLAEELEVGSEVYFWSGSNWVRTYKEEDEGEIDWIGQAKTKVLSYGEMFFVSPATDGDYTLAGEVPSAPETQVGMLGKGTLNAVGFAYPTPKKFSETDLYEKAPVGTDVFFWSGSNWVRTYKEEDEGEVDWIGQAKTKVLEPGEGFFVQFPGDDGLTAWEQSKPYEWP